jgi:argininosuccinate lyase
MASAKKLWGGRFSGETDPLMDKFNASINFDKRLHEADILGSQAYAKALSRRNIITTEEKDTLVNGLEDVLKEWRENTFIIKEGDEDIHTANERRLGELVGNVAGKLHTGRSRNDQVATDFRLWAREEAKKLHDYLKHLISVVVERAKKEIDVIMPGYTHLQVG